MEKIFTIYQEFIFSEVHKRSAYEGKYARDNEGNTLFEDLSTTDSNRDLLGTFFSDALGNLANALKGILVSLETQDSITTIVVNLSNDYNDTLSVTIENDMSTYLVLSVLSKWFAITSPNKAESYAAGAANYLNGILQQLYYKQPPKRAKG